MDSGPRKRRPVLVLLLAFDKSFPAKDAKNTKRMFFWCFSCISRANKLESSHTKGDKRMKIRYLFLVFIISVAATITPAQRRTVTNSDLERYRQERVRAEDELRQEYARNGTSYDEVVRRNRESQKEMIELAAKLRAERLERERIEVEEETAARTAEAYRRVSAAVYFQEPDDWNGGWFGGYGFGSGRHGRFGSRQFQQQGYFAGGQFWPTGPATRPQPLFRVGPRR